MIFLSELLKTKGYSSLHFVWILPLFLITMFFISFYKLSLEDFLNNIGPSQDKNPWYNYYTMPLFILPLLLPLVVSLTTFIIKNIEDRANGWKSIFVLPIPTFQMHQIKFSVIILYIFLFNLFTLLFFIISAHLLSMLKPEFNFNDYPSYSSYLTSQFIVYFFVSLSIASFTYLYAIFFKRAIVSLLLCIFLPLIGIVFTYSINLYTLASSITRYSKFPRIRHINLFGSAQGFDLRVSHDFDIYIFLWIAFSWLVIYFLSKRPVINYH